VLIVAFFLLVGGGSTIAGVPDARVLWWRGGVEGHRRGRAHIRRLEFLKKEHVAKWKEGRERDEEGCEIPHFLVIVVENLDGVPHYGVIHVWGAEVSEGIHNCLLV
jgi:hypothetical protein